MNSQYYPILNVWIKKRNNKAKIKNFRILLDSGCSSAILTRNLIEKLIPKNTLW